MSSPSPAQQPVSWPQWRDDFFSPGPGFGDINDELTVASTAARVVASVETGATGNCVHRYTTEKWTSVRLCLQLFHDALQAPLELGFLPPEVRQHGGSGGGLATHLLLLALDVRQLVAQDAAPHGGGAHLLRVHHLHLARGQVLLLALLPTPVAAPTVLTPAAAAEPHLSAHVTLTMSSPSPAQQPVSWPQWRDDFFSPGPGFGRMQFADTPPPPAKRASRTSAREGAGTQLGGGSNDDDGATSSGTSAASAGASLCERWMSRTVGYLRSSTAALD
eukprot:CAMPEP_0197614652 /NCGR_PEP_ID=MMETSP1326-20131121/59634_1 /TAXON_ID=1155430 /ORGANISM="Genus nov. species nov., Strain RCC2288" /LENGTH=275 /DNA_ID=CAMNT_0043183527 /DNA_START=403 /DNA_END=1230 /DNA_ORIENTATION=+